MIKLVYDLKAGFEDCYLTIKNEEFDLVDMLEVFVENPDDELVPEINYISEEDLYNQYRSNVPGLLDELRGNGLMDLLYEDSLLTVSKLYFSHKLGGCPIKHVVPIWEPSNWRLVYEPAVRTSVHYLNAMSAKEVCDALKLTRQQLHYYVKTEQIRKEYNPENPAQFKYNKTDVYALQKKLEKKYDRYSK
jgi:hypothetical protein